MRMKRKLLCAFALCFLSVSALADAPDETERLVVYTSHKEEVYQPIVEEFERRTGVWVQVVSGGTTELLERIAAEAETPVADVMFGGGVESLLAYEDYFMPCDAPRDAMLAECRFENHRFVAFSRLPLAIIYNPRLVSRPPAGFADLLDERSARADCVRQSRRIRFELHRAGYADAGARRRKRACPVSPITCAGMSFPDQARSFPPWRQAKCAWAWRCMRRRKSACWRANTSR